MKLILVSLCLLFTVAGNTQNLKGSYIGTELRPFRVDAFGQLKLSPQEYFLHKDWKLDVKLTIADNRIVITKKYFYIAEGGRKVYSDSALNERRYVGFIKKIDDRYIATVELLNRPAFYPYPAGFTGSLGSSPEYKKDYDNNRLEPTSHLRVVKFADSRYPVYAEMMVQDLIIREGEGGVWINNAFYNKVD